MGRVVPLDAEGCAGAGIAGGHNGVDVIRDTCRQQLVALEHDLILGVEVSVVQIKLGGSGWISSSAMNGVPCHDCSSPLQIERLNDAGSSGRADRQEEIVVCDELVGSEGERAGARDRRVDEFVLADVEGLSRLGADTGANDIEAAQSSLRDGGPVVLGLVTARVVQAHQGMTAIVDHIRILKNDVVGKEEGRKSTV